MFPASLIILSLPERIAKTIKIKVKLYLTRIILFFKKTNIN